MTTTEPLTFESYSEARLPIGFCLFFPRLVEEQRNMSRPRPKDVKRVVIVAAGERDRRSLTGGRIGSVLHVDLERKAFFELLEELEKRDLKAAPLRIAFDLDEGGLLQRLYVDDKTLVRSAQPSDITELQNTA